MTRRVRRQRFLSQVAAFVLETSKTSPLDQFYEVSFRRFFGGSTLCEVTFFVRARQVPRRVFEVVRENVQS